MMAALTRAFTEELIYYKILMITATIAVTIAWAYLFRHSIKAIRIRQDHLRL
jgi:uncharacterized membrane protein